ncbi:transglycosylase domain-containing protein [Savagea faecisuis]|uniref:Transglycosylase domain-containing protein n=1 Tax=Savagea faecisuis TaxID=1274803 RepID=A0ABW3GZ17_9BACL
MSHKQNEERFATRFERKYNEFQQSKAGSIIRIGSGIAWNLMILLLVVMFIGGIFAVSVGAGYFAHLVSKEPLRSPEEMRNAVFNYEETSEIYYANNVFFGTINADIEREKTTLDKISPYVIDAVYATEDEYFEEHEGIVPKAIIRGLLQDITNSSSQTGGSTLTQQLIKNQILTNEVSYERKAKEILLAMRLEHFMTKDEILEAYLNVIPYGRNAIGQNIAGVETAAQGIFNKPASDLNLPQSAFIAGIPQAPFAYTPFKSNVSGGGLKSDDLLERGISRMKTVLFRMKETGYITEAEYEEALAYDIKKDFREPYLRANIEEPYLTQEIQNRTVDILTEIFAAEDGIDPERLEQEQKLKEKYRIIADRAMRTEGYRIHSTIDRDMYKEMNRVAKEYQNYGFTYKREKRDPETGEKYLVDDPVQVGAMMIENSTGRILSFVGGRDFELSEVNHATQAYRHLGSSIKPLLVYAPAIEYGVIGAGSPVVDVKFTSKGWSPSNYIASYEAGIIPAREALAMSLNVATVRLYYDIIDRRPMEFLHNMGFSRLTETDYTVPSAALGTVDASVEENTNAFATLGNGGKYAKSYMIERIEDKEGNIIYQHEVNPVEVFSPETAYIVTDMLKGVLYGNGTAPAVTGQMNFRPDMAAKTGTSNDFADSWLVGYTPNVSLGVWFGYKDKIVENGVKRNLAQRSGAHPTTRVSGLFSRLMNVANATNPDVIQAGARFERPAQVVNRSFCGISGLAPSEACSAAGLVRSDLFNAKVMVPSKADDSIISGSYVSVKGENYLAHPSTPAEFIRAGGTGVNEQFIQRMLAPLGGNASKLFPANSLFAKSVVSGKVFPADDVAPAPVTVSYNGSTLTWTASPSNDVIGYYVMRDGVRIATIQDGQSLSLNVNGGGNLSVVAVDITGLTSTPASISVEEEEEEVPEEEIPEEKPEEPETPSEKPEEKPEEKPNKPEAPEEDKES